MKVSIRYPESVHELRQSLQSLVRQLNDALTELSAKTDESVEIVNSNGGGLLFHDGAPMMTGNLPFHPQSLLLANGKPLLWADGHEALLADGRRQAAEALAEYDITVLGIGRPREKLETELTRAAPIASEYATAST